MEQEWDAGGNEAHYYDDHVMEDDGARDGAVEYDDEEGLLGNSDREEESRRGGGVDADGDVEFDNEVLGELVGGSSEDEEEGDDGVEEGVAGNNGDDGAAGNNDNEAAEGIDCDENGEEDDGIPSDVAASSSPPTTELDRLRVEIVRLTKELNDTRSQLSVVLGERMLPVGGGEAEDAVQGQAAGEEGIASGDVASQEEAPGVADGGNSGDVAPQEEAPGVMDAENNGDVAPQEEAPAGGASAQERPRGKKVPWGVHSVLEDGARRWGSLENYSKQIEQHIAKYPKFGKELTLANQRRFDTERMLDDALSSLKEFRAARSKLVARAVGAERNVTVLQRRLDGLGVAGQATDSTADRGDLAERVQKAEGAVLELRKTLKKTEQSLVAARNGLEYRKTEAGRFMDEQERLENELAKAETEMAYFIGERRRLEQVGRDAAAALRWDVRVVHYYCVVLV